MSGVFFDDEARVILERVAKRFRIRVGELTSAGRSERLVTARWIAMWLMSQVGGSSVQIGRCIGRDHATVLHGLGAIETMAAEHPRISRTLTELQHGLPVSARSLVAAGAGL